MMGEVRTKLVQLNSGDGDCMAFVDAPLWFLHHFTNKELNNFIPIHSVDLILCKVWRKMKIIYSWAKQEGNEKMKFLNITLVLSLISIK